MAQKKQNLNPPRSKKAAATAETIIEVQTAPQDEPGASAATDDAAATANPERHQAKSYAAAVVAALGLAIVAIGLAAGVLYFQLSQPDHAMRADMLTAEVKALAGEIDASRSGRDDLATAAELDALSTRLGDDIARLATAVETLAETPPVDPVTTEPTDLAPLMVQMESLAIRLEDINTRVEAMAAAMQQVQDQTPVPTESSPTESVPAESPVTEAEPQSGWQQFFGDFFRITRIDEGQQ